LTLEKTRALSCAEAWINASTYRVSGIWGKGNMLSVKILIVDDEKNLVHFLRKALLLEWPNIQVDTAVSGEEGLGCLAETSYDLLIADLRMPGFDGLELIEGVRYIDREISIILVTGYGSELLRQEAEQLGVDCYMDKPLDVQNFLLAVQRLAPVDGGADD
jgi:YesN/AraC family two-component response regulator